MTKKGLENDTSQERVDEIAKQRHDLNRPIETDYVSQVAYTRALERFCDALLAQHTWVGLTNDEVNNLAAGCHLGNSVQDAIYKAVAKLKEKNT